MSSWFSQLSEKVSAKVISVQEQISTLDSDNILEKLTLTTPELTAERHRIDAEERRKEELRDALAHLLPWETTDPDRDILVEECKEAILKLSSEKATFFGPYPMPPRNANIEPQNKNSDKDGNPVIDEKQAEAVEHLRDLKPSAESQAKLAKLEPLPALLADFDFTMHVGLIQRMLSVDKTLVKMQSQFSGGGKREHIFWRNYFFHCAFTRYEAGLSIDEIWSTEAVQEHQQQRKEAAEAKQHKKKETEEETIVFKDDQNNANAMNLKQESFHHEDDQEHAANADALQSSQPVQKSATPIPSAPSSGTKIPRADSGSEFEMVEEQQTKNPTTKAATTTSNAAVNVDDDDDDIDLDGLDFPATDGDGGGDDYELDELEAEIARELED